MASADAFLERTMGCFLILTVIGTCISLVHSSYVPAIIVTSNSDRLPSESISAVHKISAKEFQDDYLNKLKGPLVLFLQDILSLEDFGMYGNSYSSDAENSSFFNLEAFMDKHPSLYIPAVETKKDAFQFATNIRKVQKVKDDYLTEISKIDITPNTVIWIQLPDTTISSNRQSSLRSNDELMGDILRKIEQSSKEYSVVYTGKQPSWTSDQDDQIRISRQILQATAENDVTNGLIINDTFTMFHTLNVTFFREESNDTRNATLLLLTYSKSSTSMVNDTVTFSLTMVTDDESPVEIRFKFGYTSSVWHLSSLELEAEKFFPGIERLITPELWAPSGMSYVCQNMGKLYNTNQTFRSLGIEFDVLQIQPFFNSSTDQFGEGFDCVGFFTIPIWMGIFVTIILLLILTFGITILLDINTMDRFDDPKGKMITVPSGD